MEDKMSTLITARIPMVTSVFETDDGAEWRKATLDGVLLTLRISPEGEASEWSTAALPDGAREICGRASRWTVPGDCGGADGPSPVSIRSPHLGTPRMATAPSGRRGSPP
jgi:hypothetical protein